MSRQRLSDGILVTAAMALAVLPLCAMSVDAPSAPTTQAAKPSAEVAVNSQAKMPASTPSAARFPRNAEEFGRMFEDTKNWGRWGSNDQLGTLNLITDQNRNQAFALAKLRRTVGLSHSPLTEVAADNSKPFEHTMHLANPEGAGDTYTFSYHGTAHSHLDALCHLSYKGKTYNGYPKADVLTDKGCTKLGVENLRNGIVTRAILVDIPRLKNVPYLEPGTPVFVEDIEAWEKKAGIKISQGDAVLLRTGRWARRAKVGASDVLKEGGAGFHASVAPWFKARGVALVGSDLALDVLPSQVEGVLIPLHQLVIVSLGMPILDNQDLEAAADVAAQLKRWEFMLNVAPLPVVGGTGSPVNALAVF